MPIGRRVKVITDVAPPRQQDAGYHKGHVVTSGEADHVAGDDRRHKPERVAADHQERHGEPDIAGIGQ